ncbi:MAG: hypothetical protein U0694_26340 [Anaerolineae bacterium]
MTYRRLLLGVLIFVGLCSVYMIFYSANYAEFGDSPYLYNITASLVRYNDTLFDLWAYNWPTRTDNTFFQNQLYPLYYYREDLTSVVLATPLYWLAYNTPGLGLLHTVWLFNIFVCAGAGSLLFAYALALGYSERTALLAALTLGLATTVLPYSKVFLQEPITLLVTLALAFALERWRAARYHWRWLLPIAVLLFAFFNAKLSSYAALPGLLLIAIPATRAISERVWKWLSLAVFALIALVTLFTAFGDIRPLLAWLTAPIANVYLRPLDAYVYQYLDNPYISIAVRTYVFSIGASIWATSPPVLLALPGAWMRFRSGHLRYIWVCLFVVVGYVFSYGLLRGLAWYGSVTYPPRFLVPAVPFLLLLALPALERLTHSPRPRLLSAAFVVLVLYGAWIAFNGVSYRWDTHDKLLPAGMLLSEGQAAYDLQYAPWVLLPSLWGQRPFDFAWVRAQLWGIPLLFGGLALLCALAVWRVQHLSSQASTRMRRGLSLVLPPVALLLAMYITLRLLYVDRLYWGENPELHAAVATIDQVTQPPDMVFVTGREHIVFMLNYGAVHHARLVGLPFQRGEQYSPEQPPLVESDNLDDLLDESTPPLLRAAALQREHLWLLTEFGPFHPWARRVVEHWMAREYYPLQVIEIAPAVRLLEFATATPLANQTPVDRGTNLRFGDHLQLQQVTLPLGTEYHAGDALPVTFYWQTDAVLDTSYTVAFFLADESGVRVHGTDSPPQLGFAPTNTWQPGIPVHDNRALRLPADLPAGAYQLWLVLYPSGTDGSTRLAVTGSTTPDGEIAILPLTITVR